MLGDDTYFQTHVLQNATNNYYWTDDWSSSFYISLAKKGFICTSYDTKGGLVLLPELQFDYAILDFKELHISKKVRNLLDKDTFVFSTNTNFEEVLNSIAVSHKDNWLKDEYQELMMDLYRNNNVENEFEIKSFELRNSKTNELIAGEVGYSIGETYTSLSGFCLRDKKYNNYGTLQLVLLSKYLQKNKFAFWNLGHPHMEYKKKLGARVHKREEFLKRWFESSLLPTIYSS